MREGYSCACWARLRRRVLRCAAVAALAAVWAPPVGAQATSEAAQATPDVAAQIFSERCAGCHSIGGGVLMGPDLVSIPGRPRADVESAITRMSKSVGPLTPEEVGLLADLLMSKDAAARVQGAQEAVQLQEAATLEPGDAAVGLALFQGRRRLSNRGLACAACHSVGGSGGSLAVPLDDAFARLGEGSLMSATEKPAFPAMRAAYLNHAVTKQEATHIARYLESLPQKPVAAGTNPVGWAGLLGAAAALAAVGLIYRHRPGGSVRTRLVREAMAGTRRHGAAGRNA